METSVDALGLPTILCQRSDKESLGIKSGAGNQPLALVH